MRAVEQIDYKALVTEMAQAGWRGMLQVLRAKLEALPRPKYEKEKVFFWQSLFHATRHHESDDANVVWAWLCIQPFVRQFFPTGNGSAPKINERRRRKAVSLMFWCAPEKELSGQAFMVEAQRLGKLLARPKRSVKAQNFALRRYVERFCRSNSWLLVHAHLLELGFPALGTRKGINWLRANY